jgi:hypothetical protein
MEKCFMEFGDRRQYLNVDLSERNSVQFLVSFMADTCACIILHSSSFLSSRIYSVRFISI